jgi:hypothetical protein
MDKIPHHNVPVGTLVLFPKGTLVSIPSDPSNSHWSLTPEITAIRCAGIDMMERMLFMFSDGTYAYVSSHDLYRAQTLSGV